MNIIYKTGETPATEDIIELFENACLPRPTQDGKRISKMYQNSNLIITVRHSGLPVGVSRSVTDWVWSCYLADLVVREG